MVLALPAASPCAATDALLEVRGDREVALSVHADLDYLLIGGVADPTSRLRAMAALGGEDLERSLERLRGMLWRRVKVRAEGLAGDDVLRGDLLFPHRQDGADGSLLTLGAVARFDLEVPAEATALTVFLSRSFGPVVLRVRYERQAGEPASYDLEPGERSPGIELLPHQASGP